MINHDPPLFIFGFAGGFDKAKDTLINLVDTVECIRISAENPANRGEFRVFNQFTEQMSVADIARTVSDAFPGPCSVEQVENPRVEAESHYYRAAHTRLLDLGLDIPKDGDLFRLPAAPRWTR